MVKNFNSNTDNNPVWLTPPRIIESLGVFDLDPCSPSAEDRPWATASEHFDGKDNGLVREWHGRVWCNPPYGRETFRWINKLAAHGNGISLIFARTETKGFHDEVWGKASGVFFFKGRLRFFKITGEEGGVANAPSCLIIYGANNIEAVNNSGLKGKLINLR